MSQRIPLRCIVLLTLAVAASAQSVRFRGKVEDVSGMAGQFFVDCTDVNLTSATITLQTFVGQQAEITGTWNGSTTDPSVEVTAIAAAFEDFEIGGSDKIGEEANLHASGTPGNTVLFFGGVAAGFFPLPSAGAVLIDPPSAEILASGTIPASGQLEIPAPIPNNPALLGVTYHGQALIRDVTTGNFTLTTNDCRTFQLP